MNVYRYIAETNPNEANDICEKNGLMGARSIDGIAFYLQSIVAQNGEVALKEILSLHPDKDVIIEMFQPKEEPKPVEITTSKTMNADGQQTTSTLPYQTNTYILIAAVIVSIAIISSKK